MKSLIKKLLKEELKALGYGDSEIGQVYNVGKKFYPNLKFFQARTASDKRLKLRAFVNYPSNKGSYDIHWFKLHIAELKVKQIAEWFKQAGVKDVQYSQSTASVYLKIGDKNVRISDHGKKGFEGMNIVVHWNSNVLEIVNKLYALMH